MSSLSKNINIISRCAMAYRTERFDGCGISAAHYFYIFSICKNPGISQDKLAKNLYLNKSSVARALQVLENDGFIERRQNECDRRITLVFPTQKAVELLPFISEIAKNWNEFLFEALDENEQKIFTQLLEKVANRAASYFDERSEDSK